MNINKLQWVKDYYKKCETFKDFNGYKQEYNKIKNQKLICTVDFSNIILGKPDIIVITSLSRTCLFKKSKEDLYGNGFCEIIDYKK